MERSGHSRDVRVPLHGASLTYKLIVWHARRIDKVPLLGMKVQVQKLLKETRDLEYTVVHNGFFLDWWVHAGIKSYTKNVTWIVDIANNIAAIPGSGDVPAVFTHTTDVAKYTAALLELPKWEAEYFIKGDRVTWHEFVKIAEDIKGMAPRLHFIWPSSPLTTSQAPDFRSLMITVNY